MTANANFSLTDAITELRRQQERLEAASTKVREVKTKVTSKDGMITVTLDGRGEIAAIAFNTAKFRRMAPAELGAALVETIGKARAEAREQVMSAYRSFIPEGIGLDEMFSGKADLSGMFDDAVRRAQHIMAHGPATEGNGGKATRQGGQHA